MNQSSARRPGRRRSTVTQPPKGFRYISDFVSPEEEVRVLHLYMEGGVPRPEWPFSIKGYARPHPSYKNLHHGLVTDGRRLTPGGPPIPSEVALLRDRCATFLSLPAESFPQAIVSCYAAGRGITTPHIDRIALYGTPIAAISFGAWATLTLETREERFFAPLAPRSLYVLDGDARFVWLHSVLTAEDGGSRLSVTFRPPAAPVTA